MGKKSGQKVNKDNKKAGTPVRIKENGAAGRMKEPFPTAVINLSVVLILAGMQLVFHDYYFDILLTKYWYFCICAITASVLCLGYVFLTARKKNGRKAGVRKAGERKNGRRKKGEGLSGLLSWTDIMVLAFAAVSLISTALSPFKYEAFWGNEGRYTGAFLTIVYTVYYFCLTRFYGDRKWHIEAFLAAGMLMCLLGLTDFFGIDLLGFKDQMVESQRYIFTSTIGNINTYTACVAMVMAVAGVMFATGMGIWRNVRYGLCVFIAFAALIAGQSDNAYLSLAMFFGFLPLYLFRSRRGVRRYVTLLAMFFTAAAGISFAQTAFAGRVVPIGGLFAVLAKSSLLAPAAVFLWLTAAVLYLFEYAAGRRKQAEENPGAVKAEPGLGETGPGTVKAESGLEKIEPGTKRNKPGEKKEKGEREQRKQEKGENETREDGKREGGKPADGFAGTSADSGARLRIGIWCGVIAAAACAVAWVLYDVNVAGNAQRYGSLQKYLLFNDSWGTNRGFAWRIAFENYKRLPFIHKLFGFGPDTFSLLSYFNNYEEMVANYDVFYDSVHNEYLQYLVTVGPIGLLSYLGIIASMVRSVWKNSLDHPAAVGCMFAVLCYGAQAIVNINQPIAAPIMWTLLCVAAAVSVSGKRGGR